MELIPNNIAREIPKVGHYALSDESEIVITVKLFALASSACWLVAEFDPRTGVMFCYADIFGEGRIGGAEWGYTYIQELESIRWLGIPRVERDLYFTPTKFTECVDKEGKIIV